MDHSAHTDHHNSHPSNGSADARADAHHGRVHDAQAGGHQAHAKHAGHDPDAFRRQFWIVLVLTIPVVIWSQEVQQWLGYEAPTVPGSEWIAPILGTVVFVYGGRVSCKERASSCTTGNPG